MNSMNQSTTRASLVVALALACFVMLPNAPAVIPPPDGGYPGGNTAEGQNALRSFYKHIDRSARHHTAVFFAQVQEGDQADGRRQRSCPCA